MDGHITVQIASLPARETTLEKTVSSLLPQVDRIFVALNGYAFIPEFLDNPKIEAVIMDNSLGDAAKFYDVDKWDGYFFTCDDDLIYPEGYIGYMISGIKRYHGVVSLHGKRYKNRPISSYRGGYTSIFRCLSSVQNDYSVDVGGTGVMAFHTDDLQLSIDDFLKPNMADLWLAKAAHRQGVGITVLAHPKKYIKHKKYNWRIWTHAGADTFQTEVLNLFLK
ncbi:hypothetical protein LCGC14_2411730 [marine sediment metagenome]|uniref:Glycosyltransferase 2-like domain-containing protein n=1 Tax=marine sediment metagenome TaxID=412755 RepID=A0A0F9CEG7_9ZZZZ